MCRILLSINPQYVESIMSGTKRYEFRKVKCKEKVDKIIIYSTYPVMKVVGEAEVIDVLVSSPEEVWKKTSSFSGITKEFYDSYFSGHQRAVAYKLGSVKKYKKPVNLLDFGIKAAPQSFVYI